MVEFDFDSPMITKLDRIFGKTQNAGSYLSLTVDLSQSIKVSTSNFSIFNG